MSAVLSRRPTPAIAAPATAARVHAARLRLAQVQAVRVQALPVDWTGQLLRAAAWVGTLVLSLLVAALCVTPVWVLPSALVLTCGLLLIARGVHMAQVLELRSLWWRACWGLRRLLSADNVCRLLFVAGTLLAVWNVAGVDRMLARWLG